MNDYRRTVVAESNGLAVCARLAVLLFACSHAAFATAPCLAETLIFDDFADGDWRDGEPGSWDPIFGANPRIVEGDLQFGNGVCCPGVGWDQALEGDVSIRVKVTVENGGFGLATKFGDNVSDGYYWELPDNRNAFFLARVGGVEYLEETDLLTEVPNDQDVIMQLDVTGDHVRGWYWVDGEAPPLLPQLDLTLDHPTIDGGIAGVYNGGRSLVRSIRIADSPIAVPEPATGTYLLWSLGLLWCRLRRRRRCSTV